MEEEQKEEKQKRSRWSVFLAFLVLFFLLLALGAGVFLVSQRTTFFGRAYTPQTSGRVSFDNSYVFASPLVARADGKERIRLTIFILDNQGRGISGKPVSLGQNENLEIVATQPETDNLGRAIFDLSADRAGDYLIEARVDNQLLSQRVRVGFH
ncbi:MAG TPA: Ig-like domain-containing protein [Candidatus Bathyarchaeia archaeon]|nr:Ig-like domain-containing protein [Candidatus Bathyarchaeia archaeon]